ncbi:UDP-glucosyl transferase 78D2 [Actinidia rufa]|uniref:Glycosyltransferase n=1 Tax=Actinidia rufa TaxID=165716 RepID=A0A7J0EYG5_9ERIC|nr:UDP-glucosyl transferase 78D2 [Actinidia rufa]
MKVTLPFLAFPFGTHAAPLLTLTRCLSSSAPNLRFSFLNSAKSNAKVFSKIKPDDYRNIKPCNVDNGIPEDHVFSGHPLEAVELFLRAMPRNFENGLKEVVANTGTKITCLFTGFVLLVCGRYGGRNGRSMGGALDCLAVFCFCPYVHRCHSNEHNTCEGLTRRSHTWEFRRTILTNATQNGTHDARKATALAMNAFEEIDPTVTKDLKSKLKMVLNVGPFDLASPPKSYSDDSGCIRWLDRHEPASVAYLSFGTILTPPPNELIALAQALEAQKVPFLWSFRDTSKLHLLEAFLQRTSTQGKVVPWTPQLQVLENSSVGVFITHAGWNSVSESIAGGVPMICRPFFADQMLNSRLVVDIWQIGASVEGGTFTKSGTMRALEIVFSSEKGKKMKENIGVLKAKAKMAVGENGSSTKNFKTLLKVVSGCEEIP